MKFPGRRTGRRNRAGIRFSSFVGPVIDLSPFPDSPPLLYLSQFEQDELKAPILEIRKGAESLVGHTSKIGGEAPLCSDLQDGKGRSDYATPLVFSVAPVRGVSGALPLGRSGP